MLHEDTGGGNLYYYGMLSHKQMYNGESESYKKRNTVWDVHASGFIMVKCGPAIPTKR